MNFPSVSLLLLLSLFFIFDFIRGRKKNQFIILSSISLFFFLLIILEYYNLETLKVIVFISGAFSFFCIIPVLYEFTQNKKTLIKRLSNENYIKLHKLIFTYSFPQNIINEILENKGELDPYNPNSSFYLNCLLKDYPFKINNHDLITYQINNINIYSVGRTLTFKKYRNSRGITNVSYSSIDESIFIIPNLTNLNIPDFILRDRIPILDDIRKFFVFGKNKYISFKNYSDFSKNYIVQGKDERKIHFFFDKRICDLLIYSKIKDITIKCSKGCLYVRITDSSIINNNIDIFDIIFTLLNIKTKVLDYNRPKDSKRLSVYFINFLNDFKSYATGKSANKGEISIPPLLGASIILIFVFIIFIIIIFILS